jgi:hypothetical protein
MLIRGRRRLQKDKNNGSISRKWLRKKLRDKKELKQKDRENLIDFKDLKMRQKLEKKLRKKLDKIILLRSRLVRKLQGRSNKS